MERLDKTLIEGPTAFDGRANLCMHTDMPAPEWLVLIGRNRDSDCLAESNWQSAINALGGEGENVRIDRMGHWACGWYELLSVLANTPEHKIAADIESALADYPVLNDSDFSEREHEEAQSTWRDCYNDRDRVDYIRKNRNQFEFDNLADMLGCARGRYFAGYASELIY